MTFWAEVERFQNLIVGMFGFVGVIFTLLFNAKQARKQREEERYHDRETLRTALIVELEINRNSLMENLDQRPTKSQSAYVPTECMDDAYRSFAPTLRLLSGAEISTVMNAYLTLRTYYAKLFLIGTPPETGERHVFVPMKNVEMLTGMQKNLIGPIEQTIDALESARRFGR